MRRRPTTVVPLRRGDCFDYGHAQVSINIGIIKGVQYSGEDQAGSVLKVRRTALSVVTLLDAESPCIPENVTEFRRVDSSVEDGACTERVQRYKVVMSVAPCFSA